jgi:hypothetical protein
VAAHLTAMTAVPNSLTGFDASLRRGQVGVKSRWDKPVPNQLSRVRLADSIAIAAPGPLAVHCSRRLDRTAAELRTATK